MNDQLKVDLQNSFLRPVLVKFVDDCTDSRNVPRRLRRSTKSELVEYLVDNKCEYPPPLKKSIPRPRKPPPKPSRKIIPKPSRKIIPPKPSRANVQDHFNENTSEILNIFLTGGEIVDFMGNEEQNICRDIDTNLIKISKEIGKGLSGTVYDIAFTGEKSSRKYVLKKSLAKIDVKNIPLGSLTLSEYFDKYLKNTQSKSVFMKINGGEKFSPPPKNVIIPIYAELCKTSSQIMYKKNDKSNSDAIIPPNSYICGNEMYSEYIISLIVSDYYRSGKCANFIEMFGFATCKASESLFYQHIFMEKIDMTLRNLVETRKLLSIDMTSIIIQVIFAIGCMEKYSSITHNDLHADNIFIQIIDDNTIFKGTKLVDYKFFHYKFGGRDIYFPRGKYLVKIGDFGMSCKWSTPIVSPKKIINNIPPEWVPNFYSEMYDTAYFIYGMYMEVIITKQTHSLSQPIMFIKNLLSFITNSSGDYNSFYRSGHRPRINTLKNLPNAEPEKVLEHISKKFSKSRGNSICIGTF